MFGINGFVAVVVPEQPVVVLCPLFDLLEEVRQVIRHIVPRELEGDAGGGAVGEDVVHRPTVGVQVFLASAYSSSEGNSSLHQDRWSMRNRVCSFRFNVRYFRSKLGSSRLRMPSSMSWEAAPPIVKKVRPASSNTCPRIRWSTWGRMGCTLPPCQFSIGYFTRAS